MAVKNCMPVPTWALALSWKNILWMWRVVLRHIFFNGFCRRDALSTALHAKASAQAVRDGRRPVKKGIRVRRITFIFFLFLLPLLISLPIGSAFYRIGNAIWQSLHAPLPMLGEAEGKNSVNAEVNTAGSRVVLSSPFSAKAIDGAFAFHHADGGQMQFFAPLSFYQKQPEIVGRLIREGHRPGLLISRPSDNEIWARWTVLRELTVANLLLARMLHAAPLNSMAAMYASGDDQLIIDRVQSAVAPVSMSAGVPINALRPRLDQEMGIGPGVLALADLLWPGVLILFHALVIITCLQGTLMLFFAYRRRKNPARQVSDTQGWPDISVLVPAYNEEAVICATVRSLLASNYPGKLEIVVIDDGSKDATSAVIRQHFFSDTRVHLLHKPNGGKASALNLGLQDVRSEIVAVIDADTLLHPFALKHLAANFINADVAAVSGNMQVGNLISEWTRQQSHEYCCANNIERRAQEYLGCITVVPGAIGAYRRSVLTALGGYHSDTLAEDADLTVRILRAGWRIVYEELALARTEAPHQFSSFSTQRFRWTFGKLQVLWKHRDALFSKDHSRLGWIGLPSMALFTFALPLVVFLVRLMQLLVLTLLCIAPSWSTNLSLVAPLDLALAWLIGEAFLLDMLKRLTNVLSRRHDRRIPGAITLPLIGWLPLLRFFTGMLTQFLMNTVLILMVYRSLVRSQSDKNTHWNKLQRTATVTAEFGAEAL